MAVTRVLHRAGNLRELHHLATHPAVDAIEADIWVRGKRLIAHHDRPLGPLPFTIGRDGLRRIREPVDIESILEAVTDHADFVIDLRALFGDPAPDLVRVLAPLPDLERIHVTCEKWAIADRLLAWLPDLNIAYSIRSEKQLRFYLDARDRDEIPPTPVVIRHTLLHSRDEVALLRQRAGKVGAWTVDDIDRALELADWGVDNIVSNHVVVLNAL